MNADITQRKADHIDLAARGDVGFHQTTTLFECIRLVHDALPEAHLDELDTSATLFGKRLRAPIIIAAMTGGTPRARDLNRDLARLAERRGYGFGLGSQRAMHIDHGRGDTYLVRDVAPSTLVLGNVGVVQAREMTTAELRSLADQVGADALCIHLNPAMEVVQPGGDRDFRGGLETLARAARDLGLPLVAKETGCGLSRPVVRRLYDAGVRHVDVSGAGGTSWVAVETQRAQGDAKALGQAFWEWGVPTAASVAFAAHEPFETIIATGGVQSGLDVAKALALGAHAAGLARPVLKALVNEGPEAAERFLDQVEAELRTAMLLTGSRRVGDLRRAGRVITGELRDWLAAGH